MRAHHEFAPSSLWRLKACPASLRACKGLKEQASPEAESGTRVHALVASLLTDAPPPADADKEELALAGSCVEWLWEEYPGAQILSLEEPYSYEVLGQELFFGTPDLVIKKAGGGIVIVDWKTGNAATQETIRNLQAKAYALCVLQAMRVSSVEFCFYNPRKRWHSMAVFGSASLLAQEVMSVISKAKEDDAPFYPGEACARCPAGQQGACKAASCKGELLLLAGSEGLSAWSNERCASAWRALRAFQKNAKRLEEVISREISGRWLSSGKPVAGLELAERRGAEEIADVSAFLEEASALIPREKLLSSLSISLPAVRDSCAKADAEKLEKIISRYASRKASTQALKEAKEA